MKRALIGMALMVFALVPRASNQQQLGSAFEAVTPCFYSYAKATDVCGYVTVPENREDPSNQRQIKVAVIVRKATAPSPKPDPIVFLEGGPGGSATAAYPSRLTELSQRTPDRDLVLIDQRGTGHAQPLLDCAPEAQQYPRRTSLAQLALCFQRFSKQTDLSAYNTTQNARDIQDVVSTLGYQTWNIIGVSYGTRLALTVLEQKPPGLRSVVLDSVLGSHINAIEQAHGILHTWNRVYAKQKALINNIALGIERQTVKASIAELWWTLANVQGEAALKFKLLSLRNRERFAEQQPAGPFTPPSSEVFSYPMALSTICQEEFSTSDFNAATIQLDPSWNKTLTDYVFRTGFLEFHNRLMDCRVWNVGTRNRTPGFVKSDLPVLVLADTHDINTPLEWSTATAKNLGRAQQVTTQLQGHVISTRACGAHLSQLFFANPDQALDPKTVRECDGLIVSNPK